ncbi:MAG: transglycosylase SLT domain-containing protein [Nitrospira sp.]
MATIRRRARAWRHTFRALLAALRTLPTVAQILITVAAMLLVGLGANWAYHTIRKPSEVFFPLTNALDKQPFETWREYGPLFREHATAVITPDLLAALAQVESAGNPVARTYWRWRLTWNPLELYRPASSAVGMFQITDATFQEGKRYCIHDHRVVQDGRWHDLQSCWFNSLYSRVLPSHAIELTAALLDRAVVSAIRQPRRARPTFQQKQDLAAVIHLCGAGAGHAYVARGFRLAPHQRCGDHSARSYLDRVNDMKRKFSRLAAGESLLRYVAPGNDSLD